MKYIKLIRHGETLGNEKGQYIGATDIGLSEKGRENAKRLYANSFSLMTKLKKTKIFVSPMKRCTETAEILFPGKEFEIVDGLKEFNFGIFEGKTYIDLKDDIHYKEWVNSYCKAPVLQGESQNIFIKRVLNSFFECMNKIDDGECAYYIVHGGTIKAIISSLSEMKIDFFDVETKHLDIINASFDNKHIRIDNSSYQFFCNKSCEFFPCHDVDDENLFNCIFCFCPLYYLNEKCGGDFVYTNGIKDCSNCVIPHKKDSYSYIINKLKTN